MADVTRHGHHRVRGPVRRLPERADPGGRERANVGHLAADLAAERRRAEHRLLEQDLGHLGGVVEVAADLLDDHLALVIDLGGIERGPADQLAEDGHRPLGLPSRHAHPVDSGLAIGRRVERATDALDRLAERARRRIGGGALERQVLQEVGHARPARASRGAIRPGTYAAIDTDRAAGSGAVITRGPSGSVVRSNIAGMVPVEGFPTEPGRSQSVNGDR